MNNEKLDILNKFRSLFSKAESKFGRAELMDGSLVEWVGELEEGSELFAVVDDGLQPLDDGEYETVEGLKFSVEDGEVSSIEMQEENEEEELESEEEFAQTELVDGTVVEWDAEMLDEGSQIYVIDEEGERQPAPDGQHETVEGLILSVEDGVVVEIEQLESDNDEEEDLEEHEEEEMQDEEAEEEFASAEEIIERIDVARDLLGGQEGPMDEDGKMEVLGVLDSVIDMLSEPMEAPMEEEEEMSAEEDEGGSVELDMDIEFEDNDDSSQEVELDSDEEEENNKEVRLESKITELEKTVKELSKQLKESNERLEKISKEPAVETGRKSVSNNFNKTKNKSRAAAIMAS